jgi:hypothetical protein
MGDRSIRAGQTITLRARFRDDLGEIATASGVSLNIWEPDADTDDLGAALIVGGTPTYLGEGIYEYEYLVPEYGPEGYWHDHWTGYLNAQQLTAEFLFFVSASGTVESLDCQLFNNNVVQITIPSGIQSTDGSYLEEEYEFDFMTTTSPSYTNLRKVRLEVGGFIGSLGDDTIQTSILEASLEADSITFLTGQVNERVFNHARREYTTCLAGSILLDNLGNLQLKSKTLGDLSVQYDTNGIRDMLGKLHACADKWAPQIMSGGGAKSAAQPSRVTKGVLDPDRPIVSRSWEPTEGGTARRQMPAANTRERPLGKRRFLRTYYNRKRWW